MLLCLQCSVTCGSGEQTRDVTCVGSGGMRLEETSCSTLLRPAAVRPCEMAACPRQISWHVGEWGLVRAAKTQTYVLSLRLNVKHHFCAFSLTVFIGYQPWQRGRGVLTILWWSLMMVYSYSSPFSSSALGAVAPAHGIGRWSARTNTGICIPWTSVAPTPNPPQWSAATTSPATAHRVSTQNAKWLTEIHWLNHSPVWRALVLCLFYLLSVQWFPAFRTQEDTTTHRLFSSPTCQTMQQVGFKLICWFSCLTIINIQN